MATSIEAGTRPGYADLNNMQELRAEHAEAFARQVFLTCATDFDRPVAELEVLDVGSGYGGMTVVMAKSSARVVGLEPMSEMHEVAIRAAAGRPNIEFRHGGVETLTEVEAYDLVVLDNVYEHLPNQADALKRIDRALRPGGVVYMLMPNKLWPMEVHYHLPFLSWLPVKWANRYLRLTKRGSDYSDASYAVTWWGLRKGLKVRSAWTWEFRLPVDRMATQAGTPLHYRIGMSAIQRFPSLWILSKSFLVVVKKEGQSSPSENADSRSWRE